MNMRAIFCLAPLSAVVIAAHLTNAAAFAADIPADSLKLAPGVARAAGYEAPTTTYIVANGTNVYSDHSFFSTQVTGELKRGERVEVLAKVKGWEWALVGKERLLSANIADRYDPSLVCPPQCLLVVNAGCV